MQGKRNDMKNIAFAIPGDISTPTGGYAYNRRMIAELSALGWHVEVINIGNDFPRPSKITIDTTRERLTAVTKGIPIIIDGLAFGVMPELAAELHAFHPLIALVHLPLALESGISSNEEQEFYRCECAALAHTDRIIVTSELTSIILIKDYGVAPERITIALPGNDPKQFVIKNCRIPSLLVVGSLIRRKGYDILAEALGSLKELSWRLTIAGDRKMDPSVTSAFDAKLLSIGLWDRITMMGGVSEDHLNDLYKEADIFVLPSRFESYGMAYAEAIAYGLPVIGTTACGLPKKFLEGSILITPNDIKALTDALRCLIINNVERERLAAASRKAAKLLPTWRQSAEIFAGSFP